MGVYAAAAFITVQVSDIVFPRLFLPDWTVTFIIILVIIGFPITFFLSWTYNIYPNKDYLPDKIDGIDCIEILVIDDGSTDGSFTLLSKYAYKSNG